MVVIRNSVSWYECHGIHTGLFCAMVVTRGYVSWYVCYDDLGSLLCVMEVKQGYMYMVIIEGHVCCGGHTVSPIVLWCCGGHKGSHKLRGSFRSSDA